MTISREDPRFWDIRTLERRLRKGHANKKDFEKYMKGLPDVADKIAPPEPLGPSGSTVAHGDDVSDDDGETDSPG
jgi:hypothetical protein